MVQAAVFGKGSPEVEETGRVMRVEGKVAWVQLEKNSGCGSCGLHGLCHPEMGQKPTHQVDNDAHAAVGDIVVVETSAKNRIGASLIVFGLPIVLLLLGVVFGGPLGTTPEDGAMLGGLVGLVAGLLIVAGISRVVQVFGKARPRAVKILHAAAPVPNL